MADITPGLNTNIPIFNPPDMSDQEFALFSDLVYRHAGITLPPSKRNMLVSRLLKRLRALGLHSFLDYYNYITSPGGHQAEFPHTIDMISTNKTEFFREAGHFKFLREVVLPELAARGRRVGEGKITSWSAGCSSGEEPYTLAMVMTEHLKGYGGGEFSILATDISHRMLDKGRRAVYSEVDIQNVPSDYLRKYFMRGTKGQEGYYRVAPELRNRVGFQHYNFMDDSVPFHGPMDFIFCRNVMIYFDQGTRTRLIKKFYKHLVDGGYLFIGHSETLHGMETDFKLASPTVYRKI
ncbi:MAG: protein-glutamate O-methyltransferase [Desulfovibrionales bacterium]|nr:protein-glutamate O-methyltransferase [Desulfovibrionales bacterium]